MEDFEKIYHEQYKSMHGLAMKMLSDNSQASDIVQDVFLAFFELNQRGGKILKPRSYLIRATLNKCIDCSVKLKRYESISSREYQIIDNKEERNDNKDLIRMALCAMTNDDRKLLVLYSEGYSYKEIAEIAEMKFSSLGKTLSRALKKMGEEIKKLEYELS